MFATLSATEVAFALVAVMQAVLARVWLVGGWWADEMHRAVLQWAACAGPSALSFALRVGFNSLVLTWLCLDVARALHLQARTVLRLRWPMLLALPVSIAAFGYAQRADRRGLGGGFARLLAQLHLLSQHDGLTGLPSRRAMQEALDTQMRRSRRNGEAFVLMVLDADRFQAINDQHGHAAAGRAAIQRAALVSWRLSQAKNSPYQSFELRGLSTQ